MAPSSTSNTVSTISAASGARSQDDRNRELALYHAALLQERKDTETSILTALEALLDSPFASESTPKEPAASDVARFRQLTTLFQVSDYDALIEERNLAGNCGYVFCRNSPKRTGSAGNFSRIVRGSAKWASSKNQDLQIVPNAKLEKWCDKWCGKAATYIRLQLSDVPGWERSAGATTRIRLLSDLTDGELASEMGHIGTARRNSAEKRQMLEELALERGDKAEKPIVSMDIPIREKVVVAAAAPPVNIVSDGQPWTQAIEGYMPGLPVVAPQPRSKVSDDDDRDWVL